jgi:hypothetical protein
MAWGSLPTGCTGTVPIGRYLGTNLSYGPGDSGQ